MDYRGELTKSAKNSFTIHAGIAEFKGSGTSSCTMRRLRSATRAAPPAAAP